MSEETKHHAHGSGSEYERQDMSPVRVYLFLGGLAIAGLLVYVVLWGFYHGMDAYERRHQPPQNPLAQPANADTRNVPADEVMKFPQPRLERNERLEINQFRLKEEQVLNSYGWVDQKAGVVRIPVERAMELVAQRGLSTTPRAGTVPPSEVNVVNQAAQRSDTSQQAPQPPAKGKVKK